MVASVALVAVTMGEVFVCVSARARVYVCGVALCLCACVNV